MDSEKFCEKPITTLLFVENVTSWEWNNTRSLIIALGKKLDK